MKGDEEIAIAWALSNNSRIFGHLARAALVLRLDTTCTLRRGAGLAAPRFDNLDRCCHMES